MSTGNVHLTSIAALDLMGSNLKRYQSDLEAGLRMAKDATNSAVHQLHTLAQQLERSISSLNGRLDSERGAEEPDYSTIHRLQERLDEAEERLRRCRMHITIVEERAREFGRQHQAMTAYLGGELPRSLALLVALRRHVELYGSTDGTSAFGGGGIRAGGVGGSPPPAYPKGSLEARPMSKEELLTQGDAFSSGMVSGEANSAINDFKGPYVYKDMNHWMRYGESESPPDPYLERQWTTTATAIKKGYGLVVLSNPRTVYRGLHFTAEGALGQYRDTPKSGIVTDKGFGSASVVGDIAGEFAYNGVLLTIYAPRGMTYIPMSTHTDPTQEWEMLPPPGSSYLFTNEPGNRREAIILPPGASAPAAGDNPHRFAERAWIDYAVAHPPDLSGSTG